MRGWFWRCLLGLCAMGVVAASLPAASVSSFPDPVLSAHNDTSTPFNVVSLPALRARRFDGSDFEVGPVLAEERGFTRHQISYTSAGRQIGGIINLPRVPGPRPVIVIAHGWADPATYRSGDGQLREQSYFADRGYVVVQPDYRNYGASEREEVAVVRRPLGYPEDLVNALRSLRAAGLPYVDGERIGLLGRSMGGGVALQAVVAQPDLVDAVVLSSPVSSSAADTYGRWVATRPALEEKVRSAFGTPASAPAFWRRASSRSYFDRIDVPVQLHHGTADPICPVAWSRETAQALDDAGVDVTLHEYDGEGHRLQPAWLSMIERATAFFDATV